jgi:hypothetical protein
MTRKKSGLLLGDSVRLYIISSEVFLISILVDIVGGGKDILTVYDGLVISLLLLIVSFGTSIGYFLTNSLFKSTVVSFRGIVAGVINGSLSSLYLTLSPVQLPVVQCFFLVLSVSYIGSYKRDMKTHIPNSYLRSKISIPVATRVDNDVIDSIGNKRLPDIDNVLLGVILLFLFYIALSLALGVEILRIQFLSYAGIGISVLILSLLILLIIYYDPLRILKQKTSMKILFIITYNAVLSKLHLLLFIPAVLILIYYTPHETPSLARVFTIFVLSKFISIDNESNQT